MMIAWRQIRLISLAVCVVWIGFAPVFAQRDDIDWNRARELRQRSLRGENLNEDEQAHLTWNCLARFRDS